jgi:hypothetical protein
MKQPNSTFNIPILILVLFIAGCANVVAPTGGPTDEDPPVVLRSTPPNFSIHYQGDDVRIFFDEFVTLKDLNQNFLVSPPLKEDPEIRVRGRSIIMSIEDTLAENTTYVFFFGESIVDITEGNPIPNFQFVASTGDYVDSLSVRGKVTNAFTLEPEAGVYVMMYNNIYDSVPMLERPVYISKTNAEGEFRITNMREGEYLLFALLDMNFNYLYDTPDEKIAFADSLVSPVFYEEPSLPEDTDVDEDENLEPDKEQLDHEVEEFLLPEPDNDTENGDITDTLTTTTKSKEHPFYELFLFKERDTFQRILSTSLVERGKVSIVFRIPTDSVEIREYKELFADDWYIQELNTTRDSLTLWLPQTAGDTLFLEISDRGDVIDSVRVSLTLRAPRGRRTVEDTTETFLNVRPLNIRQGGVLPYFEKLLLEAQYPLQTANLEKIEFFVSDSVPVEPAFRFLDEVKRRIELTNALLPDSSYRIFIPPATLTDIFGNVNDTLNLKFKTNNPEQYGSILVNINLPKDEEQYILQLLSNDLENVIDEKIISEDRVYHFNHLAGNNFRLRLIHDKNRNEKWDTGDYLNKIQPEPVFIYSEPIQARLNWEVEVIWNLQPPNQDNDTE